MTCCLPANQALAVGTMRNANNGVNTAPSITSTAADTSENAASADASKTISLTIDESTAVVTASSGYHVKATITNNTESTLEAGNLTVATNVFYSFVSRTDMQQWAQSGVNIPMPDTLGQVDVPAIDAGAKATVSVDVAADQDRLSAILSWGPKPVLIRYASANNRADSHTFLTRSSDGLQTAGTPAMSMTVALPLGTDAWQADDSVTTNLLTTADSADSSSNNGSDTSNDAQSSDSSSADPERIVTTNADAGNTQRALQQVLSRHPLLQVIADPTYLKAVSIPPRVSAITQPGMFDITAYAAIGDAEAYATAGVDSSQWNADTAVRQLRSALGNDNASSPVIAVQGSGAWTQQALEQARAEGYETVIADSGFSDQDDATVHTGKLVVPTSQGDITVLTSQNVLSELAQGRATSDSASGETSAAGRLARFMAQSAFYQMEQPYTSRNLLVCLGDQSSGSDVDALMNAVEQASWLSLTDINTLAAADAYQTGSEAEQTIAQASQPSEEELSSTRTTLESLASSKADISRFANSIMDTSIEPSSSDAASDKGDEQSLARQDASSTARRSKDGSAWVASLQSAHSVLALHALAPNSDVRERMVSGARSLSNQLLNGVSVVASDAITVVSESASMPVTVSNSHPYPVRVQVSSLTDSMEIVTSRFSEIEVPAKGEAQTTFTIRVSTAGSTTAHITLQDRDGVEFSDSRSTTITSALQISDKTGFGIIAAAAVLGVLGLWRQFHRKKDPDE